MHARIDNGQVVEYPIVNLRQRLPECSLPVDLTNDQLLPDGYVWVSNGAAPEHDPSTQTLVPGNPEFAGGGWVCNYTVVDLSLEEVQERADQKAAAVRVERNQRLTECDWTQVSDAPVDRVAWAAYRQALRDISSQEGFPFNITWPESPASVGIGGN